MRVAISIRQGKLSSVTLLRRLRHDSKRDISNPVVRGHVSKATTMIESFNGFAKWLRSRMGAPCGHRFAAAAGLGR